MLSEMVARRLAFAVNPATPAFSEEDIVIDSAFLQLDLVGSSCTLRLKIGLTVKIQPVLAVLAQKNDLDPVVARCGRVGRHRLAVGMPADPRDPPRRHASIFKQLPDNLRP